MNTNTLQEHPKFKKKFLIEEMKSDTESMVYIAVEMHCNASLQLYINEMTPHSFTSFAIFEKASWSL